MEEGTQGAVGRKTRQTPRLWERGWDGGMAAQQVGSISGQGAPHLGFPTWECQGFAAEDEAEY